MKILIEVEVTSDELSEEFFRPAIIHRGMFDYMMDFIKTIEVDDHVYRVRTRKMITEDAAHGGQWVTSR